MYTRIESNDESPAGERLVIVKYFLDRQGYDLQHSSARLWKGGSVPPKCKANDIAAFLDRQGICTADEDHMLIEVLLDKYETYMALEAIQQGNVVFDFSTTSAMEPGVLNIRLTDLSSGEVEGAASESSGGNSTNAGTCTLNPVGLFAFSLTVIMETADVFGKLVPNTVDPSFLLTWGPYSFFVSGLLQLIAGMYEAGRNNIYGATAFMAFGCFWLANGTKLIFLGYFPDQIPIEYTGSDAVGGFIRNFYIMAFVCILFKQTLVSSKLSSILIGMLIVQMWATSLAGWSEVFEWIQLVAGVMVSIFAFYVFTAEFTNEVYQRNVFSLHPWHEESPNQIFAAAGRGNTLQSRAVKLRSASAKERQQNTTNFHALRSVQPSPLKEAAMKEE